MSRPRLMVLVFAVVIASCGKGSSSLSTNAGPAPWPSPSDPAARLTASKLPKVTTEPLDGYHVQLEIFVDGQRQPVAANLGLVPGSDVFSPLHTHTTDGDLYVGDHPGARTYQLGDVFKLWGVRLTDKCAGKYCNVRASIDGARYTGPLPGIVLAPNRVIRLVIGRAPE